MSASVIISRRLHRWPIPDLPARHRLAGNACASCISADVSFPPSFGRWSGCSFSPPDFGKSSAFRSFRRMTPTCFTTSTSSPGLVAMIQLFNGMQSSLSMVYDREMGNMRMLLVSPFPRWFLLLANCWPAHRFRLLQVFAYLVIAWLWGIAAPQAGAMSPSFRPWC